MRRYSGLDLFAKVPSDLSSGTRTGGVVSCVAVVLVCWLSVREIGSYVMVGKKFVSKVDVDVSAGSKLRINFNVSLPQVACELVSLDVWDRIGKRSMNVTANVERWSLDASGRRRNYEGRNAKGLSLEQDFHLYDLADLHRDGVHVEPLRAHDWDHFAEETEYSFVEYFSPACRHCTAFRPTWERLAEIVEEKGLPVVIASVDCLAESLCDTISTYPTVRFLRHGDLVSTYKSDRTVEALLQFLEKTLEAENIYKHYPAAREAHDQWGTSSMKNPGCLLSGFLLVNRVPGSFHFRAASQHHSTHHANLSHVVHHLSFGLPLTTTNYLRAQAHQRRSSNIADMHHHPLDGRAYATDSEATTWYHYIQVVPSRYSLGSTYRDTFSTYQILAYSHLQTKNKATDANHQPEARFAFDLSPMAVVFQRDTSGPRFYDFITSLLARVGGAFAVAKFTNDLLSSATTAPGLR